MTFPESLSSAVWAVVPVKPLANAKSRLAPALSPQARQQLVLALLQRTLGVLKQTAGLTGIVVVCADPLILKLANDLGVETYAENEARGLNYSLYRASLELLRRGAGAMLVVPMDLPRLNPASLEPVLRPLGRPPAVVIAPDQYRRGTNILLVSPPNLMHFRFGRNSFAKHQEGARQASAKLYIIDSPNLAFDLDCPEQLDSVSHLIERE
jgi:2-phospho-L-lactate/phosphoenolpyruvate guanylyltransferase